MARVCLGQAEVEKCIISYFLFLVFCVLCFGKFQQAFGASRGVPPQTASVDLDWPITVGIVPYLSMVDTHLDMARLWSKPKCTRCVVMRRGV